MIGNTLITLAMASLSWATEIPNASDGHAQNPVWSENGKNLAFEVKTSRFSNIENLAIISEGKILIANSLKLKPYSVFSIINPNLEKTAQENGFLIKRI